jgi:hypothetical protein
MRRFGRVLMALAIGASLVVARGGKADAGAICRNPFSNPLPAVAAQSISTDGWIAFRITVPSGGASVQIVSGQAFTHADHADMQMWWRNVDGTPEGGMGLGNGFERTPKLTSNLLGHAIVRVDEPAHGSGGGCMAVSGKHFDAGTHYIVMADAARDGTSTGEVSIYSADPLVVDGVNTGSGSFLVLGEEFPAIENTHAVVWHFPLPPVEVRSMVWGVSTHAASSSMFAALNSFGGLTHTTFGVVGPTHQDQQFCSDQCELYGRPPGQYSFIAPIQADVALGSFFVLSGADVTLP